MTKTVTVEELQGLVGQTLGVSEWYEVTHSRVNDFAHATEDFSAIHIDPEHAAKTPMGVPIAHGLLTLSLGPKFICEIIDVRGHTWGLRYGYDKIRFTAPVPTGSRIRMVMSLTDAVDVAGGTRFHFREVYEIEGHERPACVADAISLYFTS